MDKISPKLIQNGSFRIAAVRTGAVSGFQRMSFEIDTPAKPAKWFKLLLTIQINWFLRNQALTKTTYTM